MQDNPSPDQIIRQAEEVSKKLNPEERHQTIGFQITMDYVTQRCCAALLAKGGEELAKALDIRKNKFAETIGHLVSWFGGDIDQELPRGPTEAAPWGSDVLVVSRRTRRFQRLPFRGACADIDGDCI